MTSCSSEPAIESSPLLTTPAPHQNMVTDSGQHEPTFRGRAPMMVAAAAAALGPLVLYVLSVVLLNSGSPEVVPEGRGGSAGSRMRFSLADAILGSDTDSPGAPAGEDSLGPPLVETPVAPDASSFDCSSLGNSIYETTCVSAEDGLYTFLDAVAPVDDRGNMNYYTISRDPRFGSSASERQQQPAYERGIISSASGRGHAAMNCAADAVEYGYDSEGGVWNEGARKPYQWNTNTDGWVWYLLDPEDGFTCAFFRTNGAACLEMYWDIVDSFKAIGMTTTLGDPSEVCFG